MSETRGTPDDDRQPTGVLPQWSDVSEWSDEHATLVGMTATTLVLLSAGALALAAAPSPAAAAAAMSSTFLLASLGLAAAGPLRERAGPVLARTRWYCRVRPEDCSPA